MSDQQQQKIDQPHSFDLSERYIPACGARHQIVTALVSVSTLLALAVVLLAAQ